MWPNKVWVSDITYAKVGRDFLYLYVVIDLYSRKVIGYAVSKSIDTELVIFVSRGKPEGLLFHSDQGTQYTASAFRQRPKQYRPHQRLGFLTPNQAEADCDTPI